MVRPQQDLCILVQQYLLFLLRMKGVLFVLTDTSYNEVVCLHYNNAMTS